MSNGEDSIEHCMNRAHIASIEAKKAFGVKYTLRRCAWVGERLHIEIKTNALLRPMTYATPYCGQALRQCCMNIAMAIPRVWTLLTMCVLM